MIAGAGLPVEVACRVLGVSGAGYYAWRSRPPSARTVRHAWLTDVIREVHAAAYGSYGARRARRAGPRARDPGWSQRGRDADAPRGHRGSHGSAETTRDAGPGERGRSGRPQIPSGRPESAVADRHYRAPDPRGQGVLRGRSRRLQQTRDRLVDQPQPDRRAHHQRARDGHRTTRSPARQHRDPFRSRHPVHLLGVHRKGSPVRARPLDGLGRRLLRQRDDRSILVTHADRTLEHAPLENQVELANAIFEYIEIFHNRRRRHSSLDMLTPIEYEKLNTPTAA